MKNCESIMAMIVTNKKTKEVKVIYLGKAALDDKEMTKVRDLAEKYDNEVSCHAMSEGCCNFQYLVGYLVTKVF